MPWTPHSLVWVDPGGMTGIVYYDHGIFGAEELPFQRACDRIWAVCADRKRELHIGWEKFTIRPDTYKLTPQPEAFEIPGMIRWAATRWGAVILPPAQPGERNRASQEELRALGWWAPGMDDAQSAAAHMLAWMKRENCVPVREARILARLHHGSG